MPTHEQINNQYLATKAEPNIREEYIRYLNGRNDSETSRNNFCYCGGVSASERVQRLKSLDLAMAAMPL